MRLVSRTWLRDCARAVRRAALQAAPVYVFVDGASLCVSRQWDGRLGELLAVYTEGVRSNWVEDDLYAFLAERGVSCFVP